MKIRTALQIGDYHTNHCEDYSFTGKIGSDKILCAVMDGCTTAIDSHFTSTLVGKILRKITIGKGYEELYNTGAYSDIDGNLKSILRELFKELVIVKNQLMLERNELLTTLIILLADTKVNAGIVLVVGDGLVSINGQVTEFDQDNKPDYLGFHLSEDFDSWYDNQNQKILFNNIQDISIATDGIFSFEQVKKVSGESAINATIFLTTDTLGAENNEMLALKLKTLEHQYGLKPTDDLALIRIMK
ncbi:protein phosphatase 2C domain-containing protein [Flavobacterium sp. RHBU_3]|uniref:protein phosphatase 2C domain-containing protein n=1 Tax=Flavobacterium sp. RHBU_3 TaxID=3391184 RepID=UPI0039856790